MYIFFTSGYKLVVTLTTSSVLWYLPDCHKYSTYISRPVQGKSLNYEIEKAKVLSVLKLVEPKVSSGSDIRVDSYRLLVLSTRV